MTLGLRFLFGTGGAFFFLGRGGGGPLLLGRLVLLIFLKEGGLVVLNEGGLRLFNEGGLRLFNEGGLAFLNESDLFPLSLLSSIESSDPTDDNEVSVVDTSLRVDVKLFRESSMSSELFSPMITR